MEIAIRQTSFPSADSWFNSLTSSFFPSIYTTVMGQERGALSIFINI